MRSIRFIYDVWLRYKDIAIQQDVIFTLTPDDIEEIARLPCFYCEQAGYTKLEYEKVISNKTFWPMRINKLARFDETKGFIYENVVPCCIFHLKQLWRQRYGTQRKV